jgi:Domain of unknown function (DUF4112)
MGERMKTISVEPVFEPPPEAVASLRRLRRVAWVMDRSIPIGGKLRVGLDPLLGLIPGLGDWLGAGVSLWMIYEAMRLGLPTSVLARMGVNVAVEATFGSVPILGDLFDAAWQANQRNLALVERHYDARLKPRSMRRIGWVFSAAALLFLAAFAGLIYLVARGVVWLLGV